MITQNFIAKIEGHGELEIDFKNEKAHLVVHEGERLFEGILVGRTAEEAYWITPRICGVCPVAHNLASLAAIEDAYGIEINETTRLLRLLMKYGQNLQSHILHLFFLALPDYLGVDSGLELEKKNPIAFKNALTLKDMADKIVYAVGGRNVHPTTTTMGGFNKIPSKNDLQELLKHLEKTVKIALWAAELSLKLEYPKLKTDLELIMKKGDKILSNIYSDKTGKNEIANIKNYKESIFEEIRDYSTAKFSKFQNREIMVGALARLSLNKNAKKYAKKYKLDFNNPFHNVPAQLIEIFKYHKLAVKITKKLLTMEMDNSIIKPSLNPTLHGVGAIEAPRGGLYHEIHLNSNGVITYANIITPTVQNLSSIEKTANALLLQTQNKTNEERKKLITMLIRAYDPCLSCSTH